MPDGKKAEKEKEQRQPVPPSGSPPPPSGSPPGVDTTQCVGETCSLLSSVFGFLATGGGRKSKRKTRRRNLKRKLGKTNKKKRSRKPKKSAKRKRSKRGKKSAKRRN